MASYRAELAITKKTYSHAGCPLCCYDRGRGRFPTSCACRTENSRLPLSLDNPPGLLGVLSLGSSWLALGRTLREIAGWDALNLQTLHEQSVLTLLLTPIHAASAQEAVPTMPVWRRGSADDVCNIAEGFFKFCHAGIKWHVQVVKD